MKVDREALAWAAGFFDGEGHVHYSVRRTPRGTAQQGISVAVAQCEQETLSRLAEALGVGRVNGPYTPKNPNARQFYQWSASAFETVQHAAAVMWPWLGSAKRQQFASALQSWADFVPDVAQCPHGDERQKCTPCRKEWTKRGWAKRREGGSN